MGMWFSHLIAHGYSYQWQLEKNAFIYMLIILVSWAEITKHCCFLYLCFPFKHSKIRENSRTNYRAPASNERHIATTVNTKWEDANPRLMIDSLKYLPRNYVVAIAANLFKNLAQNRIEIKEISIEFEYSQVQSKCSKIEVILTVKKKYWNINRQPDNRRDKLNLSKFYVA